LGAVRPVDVERAALELPRQDPAAPELVDARHRRGEALARVHQAPAQLRPLEVGAGAGADEREESCAVTEIIGDHLECIAARAVRERSNRFSSLAINRQGRITRDQLPGTNYQGRITRDQLPGTNYQGRITRDELPGTNRQGRIARD